MCRSRALCVLCCLVLTVPPKALSACPWSWLATLGYGGAGVGVPFYVASPSWPALEVLVVTSGVGLYGGSRIGRKACRLQSNGETLSAWHQSAVRLGTVMAGATAGAAVAGILTEGEGEVGSDEAILARTMAIGAVAGVAIQYLLERSRPLSAARLDVSHQNGTWTLGTRLPLH
jgi:hypothetical protein